MNKTIFPLRTSSSSLGRNSGLREGALLIPGDKSISHRALILGALAQGRTEITGILASEDVSSTARCLKQFGIQVSDFGPQMWVEGGGFRSPSEILDCGNSGTTLRLLMGVLAGQVEGRLATQEIECTFTGDDSLRGRPMLRVAEPLRKMGGQITLTRNQYAPVSLRGASLQGIEEDLKIASAQVKSAILLAGLSAQGTTVLKGKIGSRDHTERMLQYFGVQLSCTESEIRMEGKQPLRGRHVQVPGDPSTAAFWVAAACLIPGFHLRLPNISLNPTRLGLIRVFQEMGADIQTEIISENPEPVGWIEVRYAPLKGIQIPGSLVPSLIDEVPLIAVVATQAQGRTEITGAQELKVKESDRLHAICHNLKAMGVEIEIREDGFQIEGVQSLKGASIQTNHDHRIAMAFSIAALVAQGPTEIQDAECAAVSYPEFFEHLALIFSNYKV